MKHNGEILFIVRQGQLAALLLITPCYELQLRIFQELQCSFNASETMHFVIRNYSMILTWRVELLWDVRK